MLFFRISPSRHVDAVVSLSSRRADPTYEGIHYTYDPWYATVVMYLTFLMSLAERLQLLKVYRLKDTVRVQPQNIFHGLL